MKTEEKQSFRVSSECVVNIEATSADAAVQGWDQPEVQVAGSAEWVCVNQDGQALNIHPSFSHSADLIIRVPWQCAVNLHLVSGDVSLQDIHGKITAQTMSGDISAKNIQGSAHVHSVSGDIILSDSRLHDLTVDTVSGNATIESELDPEGSYRVRTVSGDLRLRIPEDQSCTVLCHSLSGEFKSNLPYESKHSGWGKVEALVNGGGVDFRVHTASGNVRIEAAGELPQTTLAEAAFRAQTALRETKPLEPQQEQAPFAIDERALADYEEPGISPAAKRMRILKAIEEGRLSVSDGLKKLRSLE